MSVARQYNNIVSFKNESGEILGFHSENLEVAQLDEDCWQALETKSGEVFDELVSWDKEISTTATNFQFKNKINQYSVNIAQVCNLACTYCAADGGSYGAQKPQADLEVVYKQLRAFINPLKNGEVFFIRFLGGEPLLYPDHIKKIADYAKLLVAGRDIRLKFSITTNATLIDDKRAQLLAKYNMSVSVSMDGTKEVNDLSRPAKNKKSSTDMILSGLKILKPYQKQLNGLRVITVFCEHNLDVLNTYKFLRTLELDGYSFSYASSKRDNELTPIFIENITKTISYIEENYGFDELVKINPLRGHLNHIHNQIRMKSHCSAGKSLVQSDTQGRLFACNWFMNDENDLIGKDDTVYSEKKSVYSKDLIDANDCMSCWARNICGGGCMFYNKSKNGDKNIKDKYFCQRTRALITTSISIYNKYNHLIK